MAENDKRVLAVTRGHKFERNGFAAMLDGLDGLAVSQAEQPAAEAFFRPEIAGEWDAYLMYDMPGYTFHPDHSPPDLHEPSAEFRRNFLAAVERGHGFVFVHHALASWPTWPEYAGVMGGRFRFLRDEDAPDSGYRHEVNQTISVTDPVHPVTAGLVDGFEITDETYLCEVSPDIRPLLTTRSALTVDNHWSTWNAVLGRRDTNDGWHHEPGAGVVAWERPHDRSRIVYLQFGDGPSAYGNPSFQRLLHNALHWVADRPA
ncbi:ThuA domain-containing protein [Rhodococcus opacus]|uniref:ThuA domain-containing protein n=1 Tax=Rhodococcus opacus TaxID=37919 RepID=A0AAX3YR98_RHOOP|nr:MULTISPECIES: ThuA domain-containing protein [Rhodococcus]MCZ4588776.1 ThuA domain-containing protein [Rhodococcus opacus]QSE85969.1 ThuA domain-containing protein [Rhodococcus koreensis]WLF51816.1 ThuA domain-containing protein [Rhodococcus opacus]WLF52387.1 ThuA domain-containing protein [Rhodococcus opacus]